MKKQIGAALLIGSTLIWASVIVGSAVVLKGTEYKEAVSKILYIGVIVHVQLLNIMLLWTKKKSEFKSGLTIILSALIWGGIIIWTSTVLKGTPYTDEIRNIISGATTAHLLFIWAPIGIMYVNEKKQSKKIDKTE
ncbi:MAG: hypothetical protein PF570_01930 [Candidatus Cloacimonetes bacterium]|jgi:surface polysaccharide O-acyltransferase-like enzyme|nr:hypothetical protein [Candidatus Cloacimonadota bacterium]